MKWHSEAAEWIRLSRAIQHGGASGKDSWKDGLAEIGSIKSICIVLRVNLIGYNL